MGFSEVSRIRRASLFSPDTVHGPELSRGSPGQPGMRLDLAPPLQGGEWTSHRSLFFLPQLTASQQIIHPGHRRVLHGLCSGLLTPVTSWRGPAPGRKVVSALTLHLGLERKSCPSFLICFSDFLTSCLGLSNSTALPYADVLLKKCVPLKEVFKAGTVF